MSAPKRFAIRWTKIAESDLAAIITRLADASPGSAEIILDRIEQAASRLDLFAQRGRIVSELKEHGIASYRELICRPWRIIYRIEERKVWIVTVIDGRRNLEDLLLERFLN